MGQFKDNAPVMLPFVNLRALCGCLRFSIFFLAVALLSAQTTRKTSAKDLPPAAYKLISIKVTGTKRYTPEEIITASTLQVGQTVNEDEFNKASQHLGETGAFSDVVYSFQFSSSGTKLDLQVTDSDQFVAARFDNFVWFTDQELFDKLHARVPLFHNQLPVAGNLADQVSDALQALLIERNVQGRVDYLRFAHGDGPIEAFIFSVTAADIRIRNVEFTGATPAELPLLQAAAKKLPGQDYLRSILRIQADKNFLPVFLERGYLKAAIADVQAKVVQDGPPETIVDVSFHVDPGRQYRLTEIHWSGDTVFPSEKLQPLIQVQAGQPANAVQLDRDLEATKKLYGTRGYMAADIRPVAEMDDSRSTVSYQIQVHEGDVYKMGDLEIHGLDKRTTARLFDLWKILGGDVYDSSYPKRFLDESAKELGPAGQWHTSVHESLNPGEKTVDVTLRFDPNPEP
jgi:outer membrane protein insertion porin family